MHFALAPSTFSLNALHTLIHVPEMGHFCRSLVAPPCMIALLAGALNDPFAALVQKQAKVGNFRIITPHDPVCGQYPPSPKPCCRFNALEAIAPFA